MVQITIDLSSGLPIYLQVMDQIKKAIAVGRLVPDTALPSVRQLATELRINPNTIARAYRELEYEGFLYKRAGAGTYVSEQSIEMSRREKQAQVGGLLEKAIIEGLHLDLSEADIRETFEETIQKVIDISDATIQKE